MTPWERLYIDALLRSRKDRIDAYETVEFVESVIGEPHSGAQELLLHRTITRLTTVDHAVQLLNLVRGTALDRYGPRILARIADTETVVRKYPGLSEHITALRQRTNYSTKSLKNWRIITDTKKLYYGAPVWTGRSTVITDLVDETRLGAMSSHEIGAILEYLVEGGFHLYQVAIMTFATEDTRWAEALHKVLAAPYLEIEAHERYMRHDFVTSSPAPHWVPHWQINAHPAARPHWRIHEVHMSRKLHGVEDLEFFDKVSVLLSLTGFLRDGMNLSPIDTELIQAITPSHPVWGFRRRDYAAARTTYQGHDIRALALGFLEGLESTVRTSMFRSRLAFHIARMTWATRARASVLTAEDGFYQQFLRAARLFQDNQFEEVLTYVDASDYGAEPVFQFLAAEAKAGLELFEQLRQQHSYAAGTADLDNEILCVTHASVPDQTGGYAIRAHGILKTLRERNVNIAAVTRPGFPDGALTEDSTVIVDDVVYRRLPATPVTRHHGEIQYMMSFVEPFKALFAQQKIRAVHVRSTFLIALPALLAARELGLKVLYEVSGLWELVYQDREDSSNVLKKSPFAELAEILTMTNVDQLIVMNEAVRNIAVDRGVDPAKIHVAPNAVDIESFTPLEPPKNDLFTIGYLGSFQDYEGLDDIVDVVKLLRERGTSIRVIMVGDGYRFIPLRARIAQEGLGSSFLLTGRVPHEEVIDYYRQMDVMVYPRRSTGATETITPLKPFEALALAKPIIVSDVAPLQEIVGNDVRGLVFTSGDINDFARAIEQFQQDPELRQRLGQAGRAWVVENRNWDIVVDTFIEAYELLNYHA